MITNLNIGYNGRFGNQLFQFASLVGISEKNGFKAIIPYKNLNSVVQTSMDGNSFNAKFELNNCFEINDDFFGDPIVKYNKQESHFHFDESFFSIPDFTNLNGYFQTEKYFDHCEERIKQILKFKEDILDESLSSLPKTENELVSIHIRRGDYTNSNPYHPLNGKEYVDLSIANFEKDYHFVIFSDDIDWCKSIWGDDINFSIFNSRSQYIDFCAMSLCHHNIISNSSFSWWASYLNKNIDKKIIAPKNWFGPGFSNYILDDLYTKKMTII